MPGFPVTVGSVVVCFHQAPAVIAPAQTAVLVGGRPLVTVPAQLGVVGCLFNVLGVFQPCVKIQWTMVSTKVLAQGQAALVMPPPNAGPAPAVCLGPAPQGVAVLQVNQTGVLVL